MRDKLIYAAGMALAAILGFGVGTVLFVSGLLGWMAHRDNFPPPLVVRVDPTLSGADAWTEGGEHIESGVNFDSIVEVEAREIDDDRLHVLVKKRSGEYGSALELDVSFTPRDEPSVSVAGWSHDSSGHVWRDGEAGGSVLFSSNSVPSEGNGTLVIAYDLIAKRSGSPVENTGKVVVRAEDLR